MNAKAGELVKTLREKELTISLAESITCGRATELLANSIGTSEVLTGSVICYSPEVKHTLLKVPKRIIDECSCESMEVTEQMARRLKRLFRSDVYAALTGLAAPGASESRSKPVGTVFLCVVYRKKTYRQRKLFRGTPRQIREKACLALYALIVSILKGS